MNTFVSRYWFSVLGLGRQTQVTKPDAMQLRRYLRYVSIEPPLSILGADERHACSLILSHKLNVDCMWAHNILAGCRGVSRGGITANWGLERI